MRPPLFFPFPGRQDGMRPPLFLRYLGAMSESLSPDTTEGFAQGRDGTRIHWSVTGHGAPALVCCDGIGCDGFAWKYIIRDFAPTHRIVRWHYRGHGRSGLPADQIGRASCRERV